MKIRIINLSITVVCFFLTLFFMHCRGLNPMSSQVPHNHLLQTKPRGKSFQFPFWFQLFECLQVPLAFGCGFRRHLNWVCQVCCISLDHFRGRFCCGKSCFIHLLQLVIYCKLTAQFFPAGLPEILQPSSDELLSSGLLPSHHQ